MTQPAGRVPPSQTQQAGTIGQMIKEARKEGITVSVIAALLGLMDGQMGVLKGSLMPKIELANKLAGMFEGIYGLLTQTGNSVGNMKTIGDANKVINEFGNNIKDLKANIAWLSKMAKKYKGTVQGQRFAKDLQLAKSLQTKLDAYIKGKPPGNPLEAFMKDLDKLQAVESKMKKLKEEIDKLPKNSPKRIELEREYNSLQVGQQEPLIKQMKALMPKIGDLAKPGEVNSTTGKETSAGPFYQLIRQAGQTIQLAQSLSGLWYNEAEMSLKFFRSYAQLATGWESKIQDVIQFFTQHTQGR